jgi:hypothetical protein
MMVVVRREAEPLKARADQHFSFITPSCSANAAWNYCNAATLTQAPAAALLASSPTELTQGLLGAAGAETLIFGLWIGFQ